MNTRKVLLVPCWLLTLLLKPLLPAEHPWKHQKCSLQWWCDGATLESVGFGVAIWVTGLCALLGLLIVAMRSK